MKVIKSLPETNKTQYVYAYYRILKIDTVREKKNDIMSQTL
jgi:hypothetical protein